MIHAALVFYFISLLQFILMITTGAAARIFRKTKENEIEGPWQKFFAIHHIVLAAQSSRYAVFILYYYGSTVAKVSSGFLL
jgi:hypothetical protein